MLAHLSTAQSLQCADEVIGENERMTLLPDGARALARGRRGRAALHAQEAPEFGTGVGSQPHLRCPPSLEGPSSLEATRPKHRDRGPGGGALTSSRAVPDPPRLTLSRRDAAAALGMSLRHFQRHVQPHLRCIYSGQLRLYPIAELERWVSEQAWRDGTVA